IRRHSHHRRRERRRGLYQLMQEASMDMTDVEQQPTPMDDNAGEAQLRLPADTLSSTLPVSELAALVEAFLLVTPEPPSIKELAAGAEVPAREIEQALEWLEQREDRGWVIQRH